MTTVAASLPAGDSPAEALSGLFAGAAAQRSPICRDYQIARSRVRFRFAGPAMLDRISGSFAHLAAADDGDEPALLVGFVSAGDDCVAIEPRPEPYVHSLYSSGKLESHQVERFPRLAAAVANPDRLPEEKAVIYAREIEGAETSAGFPLAAILVPR